MIDATYKDRFYIDETNSKSGPVVRWNSNNAIPFSDMLEQFHMAGWIDGVTRLNSTAQRVKEDAEAIARYRANYRGPSEEERFEMRAAFGAGAKVVNVLTGDSYTV